MKNINREIKTYFETKEIQHTKTYGAKVVLKGKLEEISAYFKKQEQFQKKKKTSLHLKKLEDKDETKYKVSKRK